MIKIEPHKSTPFPQFDAFTRKDDGEARRYTLARTAFMEQLVQEERVKAVFTRWGNATGWTKRAKEVAVASEKLARELGLEAYSQLSTEQISLEAPRLSRRTLTRRRRLLAAREAAVRRFARLISLLPNHIKPIKHDAVQFVRDLGLSWPFVVRELLAYFVGQHGALAVGMPFQRWNEVQLNPINLTPLNFTSPSELEAELARAKQEGLTLLKQSALTRGRVPKEKGAKAIGRNARWFCRHKIGGVTITQLAHEYHDAHHGNLMYSDCPNDPSTISKGIHQVERLLNLTRYRLR